MKAIIFGYFNIIEIQVASFSLGLKKVRTWGNTYIKVKVIKLGYIGRLQIKLTRWKLVFLKQYESNLICEASSLVGLIIRAPIS